MVDVIVERCAGLDVHRDTVVATVRVPGSGKSRRRRLQETRTFGTTIGQLERLSDWLAECGVTRVGMESTGCYWKTVFYALEERFDCWLVKGRMRKKIPQLQEALANRFDISHHGVLVAGLLAHIDALDQAIGNIEARVGIATAPYAELIELLCTIPGVGVRIAEILIAECGVDMSVFPTVAHLASWAAICPGTNQSGRKRGSGKTRNGDTWLSTALTHAAHAAVHTKDTYLA